MSNQPRLVDPIPHGVYRVGRTSYGFGESHMSTSVDFKDDPVKT